MKQLDLNENLKTVVLCLDNDDAGQKACDKFQKLLSERGITVTRLVPTLKDFNEDLVEKSKEQVLCCEMKMA